MSGDQKSIFMDSILATMTSREHLASFVPKPLDPCTANPSASLRIMKSKLGIRIALVMFAALVPQLAALLWGPSVWAQRTKVRAVFPSVDVQYLPAYLAQSRGIFKEEGLDVELIVIRGARTGVQALISGDVQFGLALGATLPAIWSGADLKVVAQMTNMLPFSLMVRPEITKVEELKGKKVGASVGSTTYALVYELLRSHGLDPEKSVEYVNMSGAAPRISAMQNGLLHATPLAPPGDFRATQLGFRRLVFFGDILPEMTFTGLVASSAFVKENPSTVNRMVRAIVRATNATREDSAAAMGPMLGYMKMAPEDAREAYHVVRRSFNPALSETSVRNMAAFVARAVGTKPTKEPKDYTDVSFLTRALAESKKH